MCLGKMLEYLKQNLETANAISALAGVSVALVALLVSALSVFFTWKALKIQRIHNHLSVRPLPYITVGDYENQLFVKIRNNGTGPLIIRKLSVLGVEEPSSTLVSNMPMLDSGVVWTNFTAASEGRSIPVGGEMVLLELTGSIDDSNFISSRQKVRTALGSLALNLEYTDIYGNELPASSRDLSWFHRSLA